MITAFSVAFASEGAGFIAVIDAPFCLARIKRRAQIRASRQKFKRLKRELQKRKRIESRKSLYGRKHIAGTRKADRKEDRAENAEADK